MFHKKAFFFTLLAILLVSIFILVFTTSRSIKETSSLESAKTEAHILGLITEDLQGNYIESAMSASTTLAIQALTQYINLTCITAPCPSFTDPEDVISLLSQGGVIGMSGSAPTTLDDLVFSISFENNTEGETLINTGAALSQIRIGGLMGQGQQFYADVDQRLKSLTVNVINNSAAGGPLSNSFIALVYDDLITYPIGYATARFQGGPGPTPTPITFTFDEWITILDDRTYKFYVFVPFDTATGDYDLEITGGNEHECIAFTTSHCDIMTTTITGVDTTSPPFYFPLDIQLDQPIIEDKSFTSLIRKYKLLANNEMNVDIEVSGDIEVDQDEDPWYVDTAGTFTINTSHTSIEFNFVKTIEKNTSIVDFYDPNSFYLDEAEPLYFEPRRINQTPIQTWDSTTFEELYLSDTYFYHEFSTSFIDRFKATHTTSPLGCCGISVLVIDTAPDSGDDDKPYLDDRFENGPDCSSSNFNYGITLPTLTLNTRFKLPLAYVEFFNLEEPYMGQVCNTP